MSELLNFLTSKEIVVVYIVAGLACVLCFIIYLIDKTYYKRKQRHNTRELNRLVEEINEIIDDEYETTPVEIYETPVLETIEDTKVDTYTAVASTPVIVEAKKEEVVETIEQANISEVEQEENDQINIENMILEAMSSEPFTEEVVTETVELTPVEETTPVIEAVKKEEKIEEKVEETLSYTTIEPNKTEAQEELMRLTEELEKAEQEAKNIDLTAYEEEQEENAIISLEELVRKSKEMYAQNENEYTQYEDEGNEPISLEDLEKRMNKVKAEVIELEASFETPVIVETETTTVPTTIEEITNSLETHTEQLKLDDLSTVKIEEEIKEATPIVKTINKPLYQANKKFEISPIISPIYGIEKFDSATDMELENTANYEKLDEEIKKTNEFLMTLKELQKNLD